MRLSCCAVIFCALIASAQSEFAPPAITYTEGKVYVEDQILEKPTILPENSVVRTEAGRVEIRLRGGVLYLGEKSSVRVMDNRPYNFNGLEMLSGSAVVTTGESGGLAVCENAVTFSAAGVFRLDLRPIPGSQYAENDCRVRIYKGAASAQLATLTTVLTSGKTMHLNRRCGDMIPTQRFDVEDVDGLDRWSRERASANPRRQ